jgi:hypothetical protein
MRTHALTLLTACAVSLAACAGPDGSTDRAPEGNGSHGAVEGAQEESEAQYRLVLADTSDGSVVVLDLLSEQTTRVDAVADLRDVRTDGRFAYLQSSADGSRVLDSGAWTWDHGDHQHYYRAAAGMLDAALPAGSVAGAFNQPTVVTDAAGTATVVDRSALEDGEIDQLATLEDVGALAIASGDEVLTGTPDGSGLQVHDLDGAVTDVDVTCTDADASARTRAGLVVGCAEGAALIDPDDWTAELIAYPEGTSPSERATAFEHRPGSTVLAALRSDAGAWALDVRAASWTPIAAPGAVAASAAGEDLPLLVLDDDGRLASFDAASGERTTAIELVERLDPAEPTPVIAIDTARAYVNDPAAGTVHEIDYADDLRIARTLRTDVTPSLMVETGW